MDSDPRLVVFFIILSTNPKMLQMMNILVKGPGKGQAGNPNLTLLVLFIRLATLGFPPKLGFIF